MPKLGYPFTLGVASGEPMPDGVIIWTRLAPDPLSRESQRPGGMPPKTVPVRWQVAADQGFTEIVASGTAHATPAWAHSVHVKVTGLRPGTEYFYRFLVGDPFAAATSPVGRTKTAPAPGGTAPVHFAVASCQRYEHGYYTAYRDLAAARPDVVFHVGDYIYEYGKPANPRPGRYVRPLELPEKECRTLQQYRNRYARIKMDPDLQAAHAAAPWVTTWDDHEVQNDYRGTTPGDGSDRAAFRARRAAAYQAYYEHLPLRVRPTADGLQMFRWRPYGAVADFLVLDCRQYRTAATMLGARQEQWLLDRLRRSTARWRVLVQPLFFSRRLFPGNPPTVSSDAWDAHPQERARILAAVAESGVADLVVLSGDVHNHWACEITADPADPAAPPLGVEFVASAITSAPPTIDVPGVRALNPHIRFFDGGRGYVRGTAGPEEFRVEHRVVGDVTKKDSPVRTAAAFRVAGGRLVPADA